MRTNVEMNTQTKRILLRAGGAEADQNENFSERLERAASSNSRPMSQHVSCLSRFRLLKL